MKKKVSETIPKKKKKEKKEKKKIPPLFPGSAKKQVDRPRQCHVISMSRDTLSKAVQTGISTRCMSRAPSPRDTLPSASVAVGSTARPFAQHGSKNEHPAGQHATAAAVALHSSSRATHRRAQRTMADARSRMVVGVGSGRTRRAGERPRHRYTTGTGPRRSRHQEKTQTYTRGGRRHSKRSKKQ